MRPAVVEGGEYLSQRFTKQYTVRRSTISLWLYFLKVNYPNYYDIEIYSNWLTSLPENGSILDQLPYINEPESDFSGLTAQLTPRLQAALASMGNSAPIQCPTVNPLPVKPSSNILDGEFNNNILDTLVPDLVPNLNELELLSHK